MGLIFTEEEIRSETPLIVITYDLWQGYFSGSDSIIGKEITLNGKSHQIIGVMPKQFESNCIFYGADIWLGKDFSLDKFANTWMRTHVRLKPGVTYEQLDAELAGIAAPLIKISTSGRWKDKDIALKTYRADKIPSNRWDPEIVFALSIPFFVLCIAGFNITNILLARLLSRRHEFAVRFAMGATRKRLVGQLLSECVLLSAVGGVLGIIVAKWVSIVAEAYGMHAEFSLNVLLIITLISIVIGLIVGFIPALRATRGDIQSDIKDSSRTASGGVKRHRFRNLLVIGQIAMATALCIAAGLLVKSYYNRKAFNPGFDISHMIRISSSLDDEIYKESETRRQYLDLSIQRITEIPGVEGISLASGKVINRYPFPTSVKLADAEDYRRCEVTIVSPNHLAMVRTPLLKGRGLEKTDRTGAPPVMVVNQSFVEKYCGTKDPLGMEVEMSLDGAKKWITVVGVIADRPNLGRKRDIGPELYISYKQFIPKWSNPQLYVVTKSNPAYLQDTIRETIQAIDRNVTVNRPVLIESDYQKAVEWDIQGLRVIVGICIFGMLMALLGIYGVVAYSISERTHELGIRLSIGATHGNLLRIVVGQGMRYALIGLVVGLLLGGSISQMAGVFFYDGHPLDPLTYLGVCGTMMTTAFLATLIPALRTLRINPMVALRYE